MALVLYASPWGAVGRPRRLPGTTHMLRVTSRITGAFGSPGASMRKAVRFSKISKHGKHASTWSSSNKASFLDDPIQARAPLSPHPDLINEGMQAHDPHQLVKSSQLLCLC